MCHGLAKVSWIQIWGNENKPWDVLKSRHSRIFHEKCDKCAFHCVRKQVLETSYAPGWEICVACSSFHYQIKTNVSCPAIKAPNVQSAGKRAAKGEAPVKTGFCSWFFFSILTAWRTAASGNQSWDNGKALCVFQRTVKTYMEFLSVQSELVFPSHQADSDNLLAR